MHKPYVLCQLIALLVFSVSIKICAQGSWTSLTNFAPNFNGGVMLLLSDGTVLAKTSSGGGDGIGNKWNKLTPDANGSYINGTWSSIAAMHDTRLYFSSQLLKDGRLYVAGGEYGTGSTKAEVYDPQTNVWTQLPSPLLAAGDTLYDANSAILDNGKVLQGIVISNASFEKKTSIYDPSTNTYAAGPVSHHSHDEASWVKLPDNSTLFVDFDATTSERYVPATNQFVTDASVPTTLYGQYDYETGPALLLPDGRAFFIGSNGHTAFYTPSGGITSGSWAVGPTIPDGLGAPDAAAAMMTNGKILYALSPVATSVNNTYLSPTYYYEFDYTNNSFTKVIDPYLDSDSANQEACYVTNMLQLPDGNILYCDQGSKLYYVYTPDGSPLTAGKPTFNTVIQNSNCDYTAVGTLFNGISEGAFYGDDAQMSTNFPLVRLSNGTHVYYTRTYNWNSRGVQRGSQSDSTNFSIPSAVPYGTYTLEVVANGIASDAYTFIYAPCTTGIEASSTDNILKTSPNPATNLLHVIVADSIENVIIYNILGKQVLQTKQTAIDVSELENGAYFILVKAGGKTRGQKIIIQH